MGKAHVIARNQRRIPDDRCSNSAKKEKKNQKIERTNSIESLEDYGFDHLYDPDNFDHLPVEERVCKYARRDLVRSKLYNIACRVYGQPNESRRRLIVAPPMPKKWEVKEVSGFMEEKPQAFCSALNPQIYEKKKQYTEEEIVEKIRSAKVSEYDKWLLERKEFRKDLDGMGLSEDYLRNKPNKTEAEKRVFRKIYQENHPKPPSPRPRKILRIKQHPKPSIPPPPPEEKPKQGKYSGSPIIKRPSPAAIQVFEKFVLENKLRLLDMFVRFDKNKNWKISKEDFREAIKRAEIPISEVLLEDLIIALDTDLNNQLDYRELAHGMDLWKIEKRESRRQDIEKEQEEGREPSSKWEDIYNESAKGTSGKDPLKSEASESNVNVKDEDSLLSLSQAVQSEDISRAKIRDSSSNLVANSSKFQGDAVEKSGSEGISSGTSGKNKSLSLSDRLHESKSCHNTKQKKSTESLESETKSSKKTKSKEAKVRINSSNKSPSKSNSNSRAASAVSQCSTSSSQYLELPEPDLRREQRIESPEAMVDLRKRNREVLESFKRGGSALSSSKKETSIDFPIKVGVPAIDNHNAQSTLGGETAKQVAKFRQLMLREYTEITRICKRNDIPLTEKLLQNVLLYPPDKDHATLKQNIRQPQMPLLSHNFAMPKKGRSQSGSGTTAGQISQNKKQFETASQQRLAMLDRRYLYRKEHDVRSKPTKQYLSTGKAYISAKSNCWLTFEEYENLTRHLSTKWTQVHGPQSPNVFWPGHLLDKIKLCMPGDPSIGPGATFQSIKSKTRCNYGYDNDLKIWPINDNGYLQLGVLDPHDNKYI